MSEKFKGEETNSSKWSVKEEREFNTEAYAIVAKAEVVNVNNVLSCCFTMVSSTIPASSVCFPMSKDSHVSVGDILDLSKAKIQLLKKPNERDVYVIIY